jgi:hypothetical protein
MFIVVDLQTKLQTKYVGLNVPALAKFYMTCSNVSLSSRAKLVVNFSPRRSNFDPRAVHVGFVLHVAAPGQVNTVCTFTKVTHFKGRKAGKTGGQTLVKGKFRLIRGH